MATEFFKVPLDLFLHGCDFHNPSFGNFRGGADREYVCQGPFRYHPMRVPFGNQNAQSFANKIVGDLVQFLKAGQIKWAIFTDRFIDRIQKPVS